LISVAASNRRYCLDFHDVRKAHLNGLSRRNVVISLPKECGGGYAILERTLYGTREAAAAWESCIREVSLGAGFKQGLSSPCLWSHEERDLRVLIHGDDVVTCGNIEDCRWLRDVMSTHWMLKNRGAIGRGGEHSSMRVLGRLVSKTEDGYEYEADPRHAELLVAAFDLKRSVTTPGTKTIDKDVDGGDEDDTKLDADGASFFRSLTMRAAYLSLDRCDLSYTCKELARDMSSPTVSSLAKLKRLCRYLQLRPRVVVKYPWQSLAKVLVAETDSDFAGCIRTRKSTSGFACFLGAHLLKTYSKTQSVIATSTGEAEFYAVVSAVSTAIGLQSLLADLMVTVSIVIKCDATTGMVMASRKGLGRAKHVATQYLWTQSIFNEGVARLDKVPGVINRSDLMTKYLPQQRSDKLLTMCGCEFREGVHSLAFKAL
jgi:hypothetical protein